MGWPDLVLASDWRRATLSAAVKQGRLRRIAQGYYTPSSDPDEAVVRRNWATVLAHTLPGAVIVDRSARTGTPGPDGVLYVDHPRSRPLVLPGLTIIPRRGPGPLPGDQELDGFVLSSPARALLDNLTGSGARYLTQPEVEEWIVDLATRRGEGRLNPLRDTARELSGRLGADAAFERLQALIRAALSTGPATGMSSPALVASAAGWPYDRERLALFGRFAAGLRERSPEVVPDLPEVASRRRLLAFYEAYFSNYIEGTEFTVDEAARIVFEGDVPSDRPADAHDVLGTYRLVADDAEMHLVPRTPDELVELAKHRHSTVMEGRPDKGPGQFKSAANRAGVTVFVAPRLAEGTLRAGFETGAGIADPFARAVFMMFLVAEVHPFTDGNGRVARIMMNAELVASGQVRIVIPTVFRSEYLAALKNATNSSSPDALASVLGFARRYTAQVDFSSRATADHDLARTNAFVEPEVSELNNIRLRLPSALDRVVG
jgi:predicted nucleic acid-binding protein